jgi:transcription initiation factor TFIIB
MTNSIKNIQKTRRQQNCPECKSTHLADRPQEECSVCLDCGFVISAETAEMKITEQQKRQRSASCHTQSGLSIREKNTVGENLIDILEQWNQVKIRDATEKNLALALQYVTKTAIDLSVPRVVLEKASLVYRRIIEKRLVKGRSMRALAATAVYIGCKQCGIAVTTKRVANVSKISPRRITRFYRLVAKQINITLEPASISIYAKDLSKKLQVSERTMATMEKLAEVLQRSKFFVGKDPTGIACAAIYVATVLNGEKRTQREIAEVARITEQTIRARCREIENSINFKMSL